MAYTYMNLLSSIANRLQAITGKRYSFPENGVISDSVRTVGIKDVAESIMMSTITFEAGLKKIQARFDKVSNLKVVKAA